MFASFVINVQISPLVNAGQVTVAASSAGSLGLRANGPLKFDWESFLRSWAGNLGLRERIPEVRLGILG